MEKVLSGEVEAAAVSDYVLEGDNKYLNTGKNPACESFRNETCPFPCHLCPGIPPCFRPCYPQEHCLMNQQNPSLRDQVFNGELVVVDQDEHLQVTREALEVQKTLKP